MATAPDSLTHAVRYRSATQMLVRTPARVTLPGVEPGARRDPPAVICTSGRCLSSWFGRSPSAASNTAVQVSTRPGCATQDPSNPSPASRCLSALTWASARSGGLGIRLGRHERGHPADRVGAAAVTGRHQQFGVRAHHRRRHGDLRPVGQHVLGPAPGEGLDVAEDVVPAAGVQPRRSGRAARRGSPPSRTPPAGSRSARSPGSCPAGCPAAPAPGRRRRSTAAPRGAIPASAGRSTGPAPLSISACALWKKNSPKSTSDAGSGRPSMRQVLLAEPPAARPHDDASAWRRRPCTPCRPPR